MTYNVGNDIASNKGEFIDEACVLLTNEIDGALHHIDHCSGVNHYLGYAILLSQSDFGGYHGFDRRDFNDTFR